MPLCIGGPDAGRDIDPVPPGYRELPLEMGSAAAGDVARFEVCLHESLRASAGLDTLCRAYAVALDRPDMGPR